MFLILVGKLWNKCLCNEVKEKDYEGKDRVAAKGQEWKDREGKKLPQKE